MVLGIKLLSEHQESSVTISKFHVVSSAFNKKRHWGSSSIYFGTDAEWNFLSFLVTWVSLVDSGRFWCNTEDVKLRPMRWSGCFCRMFGFLGHFDGLLSEGAEGFVCFLFSVAGTGVRWTGRMQRWSWRGNRTDPSWSETVLTLDTSWASASGRRESRTTHAWSTTEVRHKHSLTVFTQIIYIFWPLNIENKSTIKDTKNKSVLKRNELLF